MNDVKDYEDVIDRVEWGMEGVRYLRPAPTARRSRSHLRPIVFVAGSVGLALFIVALVLAPVGDAALAWAATPSAVSVEQAEAAATACRDDVALDLGAAGMSELPPLVIMDLRGNRAVATFVDETGHVTCLIDTTSQPWTASMSSVGPSPTDPMGDPIEIDGLATLGEGETLLSFANGAVDESVAQVVVEIPGREPAEATVEGGRFSIWWPSNLEAVVIRALADNGAELAVIRPEDYA
ncbi:MAG TPA: hypothetical protein VJA46_13135 [Acidimicrobiia bacterium]|nr:hypothetical protein [Acidimicrobiia bacterium]